MKKHIVVALATIVYVALSQPVYAQDVSMSDPSAKPTTKLVVVDERPAILKDYLAAKGSPMVDDAAFFVTEADRLNMDWKLVAAIAGVESTFGQHIPSGSYNAWGWRVFTGTNDGVHFTDWKDGITHISEGLRYRYIDKGAKTIDAIGQIYAASPLWSYKVKWFLSDIEAFHPKAPKTLAVTI